MQVFTFQGFIKPILLIIVLLSCSAATFGQRATVKGTVTDNGEPLVAVTVSAKETRTGTVTDLNGNYQMEFAAGDYTLQFSYIGYLAIIRKISLAEGQTLILDVELSETATLLNTATVTSGKFEKPLGEVTVSLEILQPELIANANATTLDIGLEKVPGVNIIDGQPNIRSGSGYSYGAGSRVLLLINDVPALQADAGFPNWNDVSLENIEQIEIVMEIRRIYAERSGARLRSLAGAFAGRQITITNRPTGPIPDGVVPEVGLDFFVAHAFEVVPAFIVFAHVF